MTKKSALAFLLFALVATNSFAVYVVVLKDGTRYRARDRWTIVSGKAMIVLESGTTLQIDPSMIDGAATQSANASQYGDARVLATGPAPTQKAPEPSLGSLRTRGLDLKNENKANTGVTGSGGTIRETPGSGRLGADVVSRFEAAYENMALYQRRVSPNGATSLRVEIVTDNEDQVFKAISATSYVMAKLPGVTGSRVDSVELVMTTLRGGSAGRFQMTLPDAQAIESKKLSWSQYYVSKVLF